MAKAVFTVADPRGLALNTATGDLSLVNGRFSFATGLDAIAQDIVITLRLFVDEWFLNLDAGTDWWSYLGEKFTSANQTALHDEITSVVTARPGVIGIRALVLSLSKDRALSISFTASTAFGDTQISTEVTNV